MQTPAGFEMRPDASGAMVAHVTDWWAVIFNPSFPYKLSHMMTACFVTVSFLLAGVSAYRWLRGDRTHSVYASLRTGIAMAALLVPLQIVLGDLHGVNTFEHQPAKLAAMEGIWETQRGVGAVLFAIPDEVARENKYEISIPKLASLYLTHDINGEVKGLNDFKGAHPPVAPVFWGFRVMVGVGVLMLLVGWLAFWRQIKAKPLQPWLAKVLVGMTFSGWVATLAGWYVTEIGRQPWLVHGVLTTEQAAASIATPLVVTTLALYITVYAVLLAAYISVLFYLARKAGMQTPPAVEVSSIFSGSAA
jgi:cytochrome d ubiquinol oxidase subunit I